MIVSRPSPNVALPTGNDCVEFCCLSSDINPGTAYFLNGFLSIPLTLLTNEPNFDCLSCLSWGEGEGLGWTRGDGLGGGEGDGIGVGVVETVGSGLVLMFKGAAG